MPSDPLGFRKHNHDACVTTAMRVVEEACDTRGLQLTPVRRRTFEILLEAHAALGAYDVLARLDAEGLGSKPPVAYRALAFLVDNGFVHRIERLNAFVACAHPGDTHDPAFMICRSCKKVAEADLQDCAFSAPAAESGFQIEQTVFEAEGLCPACQGTS